MKEKIFIVAELGINHNGDINIAKEIIKKSTDAGVDAVKFQKRSIERVYTKEELDKSRESPFGSTNREQKEGLEFNQEEYDEIDRYCKEIGIEWYASCWDLESVEFIKKYNCKYNKIPSARLNHFELLKEIAKQQKYTFISTGMSLLPEIKLAVDIFKYYKCPFELLHCNSSYPCPDEDLNMLMIPELRSIFHCKVGYSGHSPGITDAVIAAVLGATSIEKHVTLDRTIYGTDQPASLEIHGLIKVVEYIRYIEKALGDGVKKITELENKVRQKLWRIEDVRQ